MLPPLTCPRKLPRHLLIKDRLKNVSTWPFVIPLAIEGWVLFVTGVHEEATEDDFVDLFSEYGTVKDVRLPLDHRTGYIKGYALVEYPTLAEARAAISALEGSIFLDYTLHVSFAFSKGQTKRLNKE